MRLLGNIDLTSWGLKPSTGRHIEALDGVRGIAIMMVVAAHAIYINPDSGAFTHLIGALIVRGTLGVPIFFVLSAFVLSIPYFESLKNQKKLPDWKQYAWRRILKIFPPFILVVFFLTTYFYLKDPDLQYIQGALMWVSGIANFIPVKSEYLINGSFWSLLVEAQFYIVLPIIIWSLRRLPYWGAVSGLFLVLFVPSLISRYLAWENHSDFADYVFALRRFPSALDYFAWGCLFAGIYKSPELIARIRPYAKTLGYLGLSLLTFCIVYEPLMNFIHKDFTNGRESEMVRFFAGSGVFFALFFLFKPEAAFFKLCSSQPLRFVGLISYEWFLLHQPFLFESRHLAGPAEGNFFKFFLILSIPIGLTFFAAVLIYRYFSYPILKYGRARHPVQKSL